jgi:hypothetical protein
LQDAAAWVGCTNVVLDRVLPTQAHSALASALGSG